jgi:hypothetical protein
MRTLISRKMAKQKTFYEMKVMPQQPVIVAQSQPSPRMINNHASANAANALFLKN